MVYHEKNEHTPYETIHIMLKCLMHLHNHWNKSMSFMKPSILTNLNNDINFAATMVD
jgi:hypothetical protein